MEFNVGIRKVAKEINDLPYYSNKNFTYLINKFYKIMRKYNIKQGMKTEVGVTFNNPEWILCQSFFLSKMDIVNAMKSITANVPEDLQY